MDATTLTEAQNKLLKAVRQTEGNLKSGKWKEGVLKCSPRTWLIVQSYLYATPDNPVECRMNVENIGFTNFYSLHFFAKEGDAAKVFAEGEVD
jgi:hypothetical protein